MFGLEETVDGVLLEKSAARQRENRGEIGPFGGMSVTFGLNNATNLKAALTLARSF